MTKNTKRVHALGCVLILVAGCSTQPQPAAQPSPAVSAPAAETVPTETAPEVESVQPVEPSPAAVVEPEPEEQAATPAPAPSKEGWAVVDLGGQVTVAATQAGLTRIGAAKCKICHAVQYASWAEGGHGTRTPPLDCEDCHGPGSAYKDKKIMEDPDLARAAGLVDPDRAFCEQCHKFGWTDDVMQRTHAHKVED